MVVLNMLQCEVKDESILCEFIQTFKNLGQEQTLSSVAFTLGTKQKLLLQVLHVTYNPHCLTGSKLSIPVCSRK